jgi:glycosyltransferase involved in cell wall biosynthesis
MALLEALALGAPIVATNCVAGPRVILADGRYGDLVPVDSVADLAHAIERHLKKPERLERMGAAGREWAAQFTIERSARRHLDFYATLVGRSRPKGIGR